MRCEHGDSWRLTTSRLDSAIFRRKVEILIYLAKKLACWSCLLSLDNMLSAIVENTHQVQMSQDSNEAKKNLWRWPTEPEHRCNQQSRTRKQKRREELRRQWFHKERNGPLESDFTKFLRCSAIIRDPLCLVKQSSSLICACVTLTSESPPPLQLKVRRSINTRENSYLHWLLSMDVMCTSHIHQQSRHSVVQSKIDRPNKWMIFGTRAAFIPMGHK